MRILFLAFQFPYPPISGASIKTLSLLEYIRREHDVRLVSLRWGPLSAAQSEWAAGLGGARTVELDKRRNIWSLLSSYAARVPLRIERNRSPELGRAVMEEIGAFQPDAIFCDGLSTAQYVPEGYGGVRLLHEHNAEYVIWQRQAEIESGPRRWIAALEAARLRRYEAMMVRRFDRVFAVSEEDRRVLLDLGAEPARVGLLPNIPERALLDKPSPAFTETQPVVLYFGTLSWMPNIEGLERLLNSIFPEVRRQAPEARLVVAGTGASAALRERVAATEGADFRGKVEDPEDIYRQARVLVDATRSGGGTRLKVLNALARGVPVVASTVAAEGLDVVHGDHLMMANNDGEMIEAIAALFRDAGHWQALSENGRALVRARYVAEVAYRPLDEALAAARAAAT
jgi:glycosyltransferase involved in cell wall biosynthesis